MDKTNIENTFFVNKIDEIEICEGKFYRLSGSSLTRPTDFTRIENEKHNLDSCEHCKKYYQIVLRSFEKRFERFPYCCNPYKKLLKYSWFNKNDYLSAPKLATEKIFHTWNFILKYIDEPNWEEEIIDYIYYIVYTFGSFPNDSGEALFLGSYFKNLRNLIERGLREKKYDKKKRIILEYFDSFYLDKKSKSNTDLNILLEIYNR
ncbi:hypothetical protein [Adhaeribacter rhizoryzae]|uniref:Uncharacterized protein n=1 Tax=Adhaeribacter rhizoryzae TaxID=2607907 RepID=A0A5M6D1H1_9BACT|nr:hypothetical protein [Adhaeribacter rhizoryzae]KAA5540142.1 hypothetical protein F0145_23230 [Adhaeribacter rhizoryzae]